MKMKRSGSIGRSVKRVRTLSACVIALAGAASPAMADEVPPFKFPPAGPVHLLVTENCSATMITDRAAVTSAACVLKDVKTTRGSNARVEFWRAGDVEKRRLSGRVIPFVPGPQVSESRARTGVGDLALVLFDEDLRKPGEPGPTLSIPSYRTEFLLMSSPVGRRAGYLGESLSVGDLNRVVPVTVYARGGFVANGPQLEGLMDKFGPVLRSFPVAQMKEPGVYDKALSELVKADLQMDFSSEELADFVMPAPLQLSFDGPVGTRKTQDGEWGAGIYAHDGDDEVLVGLVGKEAYQIRLSYYWPWIFKTLLQNNHQYDAFAIAGRVLGMTRGRGTLTQVHTCTHVGQVYADESAIDRENGTVPFFRLMKPSFRQLGDGSYRAAECESYVQADAPGSAWEPLGNQLPSATEGRRDVFSWLFNGGFAGRGTSPIGAYYGHVNRSNAKREFFQLKVTRTDGALAPLPLDGRGDTYWDYVGERLPPAREMRLLEAPSAVR